jgi:low temperature requirement protein LtrA
VMFAATIVILFALWWLYFLEPAGEGLELNRERSYLWGYGHYGVFAALAALGAGLEVGVESIGHHIEASPLVAAYAVGIPVAVFLVLLWAIHAPIVPRLEIRPAVILPAAAAVALVPLAAPALGVVAVTVAIALVCVLVITLTVTDKVRRAVTYEA